MDTSERQTNYTIMEGYRLPSNGEIYDTPVNPIVELRSMTARDEMKRLSPSTTPFKTLSDIIEGCMIEKPAVHVYDMALGDYEFLLHKLRIVTYGSDYKLSTTCPFCGENIDAIADLESLEFTEFDLNTFESLRELDLPVSQKHIKIKFQTPRMLDNIDAKTKELKRKFKSAEINLDMYALLSTIIDSVDGNKLTTTETENFINTLPAADMLKLINNLDKLNACFGLNNELYVTCDKCGGEVKTFFRFGPEFFRPTTI